VVHERGSGLDSVANGGSSAPGIGRTIVEMRYRVIDDQLCPAEEEVEIAVHFEPVSFLFQPFLHFRGNAGLERKIVVVLLAEEILEPCSPHPVSFRSQRR
jgi:hypothetical protein